ncbi:substrate-binding domain-containing protein [Flavobacterium sp. DG1-102-2]|uniref:PstS family phosphate ABC transporter substrate-binding protein n=1 Tax=Flavobacterium sp. DG1-102-2 TaxID=3081663 RepID=UPI002949C998|nr:substrate-binding domain-containing protein [Flavobacterium sp. DG1-102-2]MDV6169152.1 substrate-binding domain-containing protein [Flavobacterium sp. DG1-102-2]
MKYTYRLFVLLVVFTAGVFSCKGDKAPGEGVNADIPTAGKTTLYADNTVQPIIEDVLAVFHSVYTRADVTQVNLNETELVNAMIKDSARVVVMSRLLTDEEESNFRRRKITPVVTQFATDAIAFITNKSAKDSVVNLDEIVKVIKGGTSDKIQKLIFDNPNSSSVQYLLKYAGVAKLPSGNIYSLKSNEEVIRYVHKNPGSVGVVGVNWLTQRPESLAKIVSDITVLGVDNVKIDKGAKKYYKPFQSNIATNSYPLTRKLYVLNYSGREGLGTGFATYIGAFEGQRIILKSGLLPVEIPTREIEVRSDL